MHPTVVVLLLNVFLLASLAVVGWRNRSLPSARAFALLQGVSAVWAGTTLAGLQLQPGPLRLRVWGITTGLSLLIVGLWLGFILSYTGREAWQTGYRGGVVVLPLAAGGVLYAALPSWPPLVASVEQTVIGAGTVVEAGVGPVGAVLGLYVYGVFAVGIGLVVETVLDGRGLFAGQAVALVLGTLVTVLASVGELVGVPTGGYPLTEVALGGQSVFWAYAVFRQQLVTSIPGIARVGERAVVGELDDGVLVVDPEGVVLRANERARTYLGTEQLVGTSVGALLESVDDPAAPDPKSRLRREGRTYQTNVSEVTNWRGETVGRALVLRDVTDLVRHQQRLQVLNRVLRHDIRNGMNVILGSVEQVGTDTPEARRAARTIRQQGTDIVEMSDKARRFEALFDGEEVAASTVDLTGVVESVADELARDHPDAEIRWNRPGPTPVRANDHLELAVRNVAENAVEHNDTASPRVEISVTEEGDTVALRVADDGPGLPALERRVIERGRETPLEHSRGIGLWLAAWVVEDTGGEIRFDDNEPRGTVITLRFPAGDPTDAETDDTTVPEGAASLASPD